MAPNDTNSIANAIIKSDIPVPWCEEFERMINGKKFVHSKSSGYRISLLLL
jgi:hypothetical protein